VFRRNRSWLLCRTPRALQLNDKVPYTPAPTPPAMPCAPRVPRRPLWNHAQPGFVSVLPPRIKRRPPNGGPAYLDTSPGDGSRLRGPRGFDNNHHPSYSFSTPAPSLRVVPVTPAMPALPRPPLYRLCTSPPQILSYPIRVRERSPTSDRASPTNPRATYAAVRDTSSSNQRLRSARPNA